jgi:hypothetical protein
MKSYLFLLIMLSAVLLIHTAFALVPMGSLVVTVKPEKSPIESDEIPVLVGTVTDQASKPIANATVNISTSYGTFGITTGNDGKFRYQYSNPVNPAQYLVNIKAQKDGYGVGLTSTTFFVHGTPVIQSQKYDLTNSSNNNINQDPVASKILQSVKITKNQQVEQDAMIKQNQEEKKFVDGQRVLVNQQLQTDLQGWFAQLNPFTPRNVYDSFISQVDQNVAGIFWGQFNFTEHKTNDGLAAQNLILQNGGSSDQARNAFIQNASSSRSEIIQVNKDLNLKYGNASNDVQSKFDKYGNLR